MCFENLVKTYNYCCRDAQNKNETTLLILVLFRLYVLYFVCNPQTNWFDFAIMIYLFCNGFFEISTKIMFSVWNMVESLKHGCYCRKIATTYWVSKLLGNFLQLMLHQPSEELAKTKFNKGVNWSNTIIHFSHQCKIFLNFFAKHDKSAKIATFSKTVLTGNFYKFLVTRNQCIEDVKLTDVNTTNMFFAD